MLCGMLRQCLFCWHYKEAKLICGIYSRGAERIKLGGPAPCVRWRAKISHEHKQATMPLKNRMPTWCGFCLDPWSANISVVVRTVRKLQSAQDQGRLTAHASALAYETEKAWLDQKTNQTPLMAEALILSTCMPK